MEANKIYKILSDIKKSKQQLSLYTFKFDELVKVDTWISELNSKDLKLGFLQKRFKIVEAILGSREEVFLYSKDSRIALSSKFLKVVENEIYIEFPQHTEVSDLRNDIRLDIDSKVHITMNKKVTIFNTFDIGFRGLSLIVKENQKPFLKEGDILKNVILHLADKKLMLDLEVRNSIKMEAYSYNDIPFAFYRVGVLFSEISEKKLDYIRRIINIKKFVG